MLTGAQIMRALRAGGDDGLERAARELLERARRNVPKGDPSVDPDPNVSLRESGRVEQDGHTRVVRFDTPYAAKVHEDQRLRHPRGGTAKYLEKELQAMVPKLERIVAGEVHKHIRG